MFEKGVKLFYLYHGLIVDEDTIHGMNIKGSSGKLIRVVFVKQ